jgi:uncharacterized protein involved in exopolysaccharide biosynthesis
VVYFTQFLPFSYTVKSSIYAGVTNNTSLDGSAINYASINSTFDNLINIAKSPGTLEKVSVRLLATALTYGQDWKDNQYVLAKHYRQLKQATPKEVLALVDRKSLDKTIANFKKYRKENGANFVYAIFNRPGAFYSASALDQIDIKRAGNSDILNITYTSADPGLTQQTISILIDELVKAYEVLRFKATQDVIAYFKEQVRLAKIELDKQEDDLMNYSVQERVINYGEETKSLANTRYEVDDRMEEVERSYQGSVSLRKMLEDKMDIRAKIIKSNTDLLKELEKVSTLNQSIMEQEIFVSDKARSESQNLGNDKRALKKAEENISHISDNLNEYNFSKEGVGIKSMIDEWLIALVNEAKAKAELKVLQARQNDIFDQYSHMSPIGTQVNRKQRAIGIAEDSYRTQLNGLAAANLRLKNIEMSTSNLQTITPPDFPLTDNGRKRAIYVLIALVGSLVFITGYFLFIEILDRTLRDPIRSKRLTGLPVIAAFNGTSNLKFRGFLRMCNRIAAGYCCRQLDNYLQTERPTIINLISMEKGEGKSFLTKYFVEYWKTEEIRVRVVKAGVDFEISNLKYVNAQRLADFWQRNEAEKDADIILVEYPSASRNSIPLEVLKEADVNLLVANACRLWRDSDDAMLQPIKEALQEQPLFLYLNNADREVVESFTGDLPPKTPVNSLFRRLSQFGLTSKKAAVK